MTTPHILLVPRPILSIDPSLRSLGYCLTQPDGRILRAGIIKQQGDATNYHRRSVFMAQAVMQVVDSTEFPETMIDIVIETPTNWFNEKGTASKDNEAIQRLYLFVGCVIGMLSRNSQVASIWGVDPVQWKGNTPKDIMVERALRHAAAQGVNLSKRTPHDTCEAVLLGKFGVNNWDDNATVAEMAYRKPLRPVYVNGVLCTDGSFAQEDFIDEDPGEGNL